MPMSDPNTPAGRSDDRGAGTAGFRVERDGGRGVATITLDVPGKLNRVPLGARDRLARLFDELAEDDAVRFVVLTGAGEAFTAGGDIAAFLEAGPEHLSRLAWNIAAAERCPKPVIARIRGYCLGVGLELALACDFRVASDDVQLGLPEVGLGMIPGSGGTQRLARLIGLGRAKDVVMRRRRIGAADALAWGLVSEIVPAAELDAAVERVIADLEQLSPLSLRMAKRVLDHVYDAPLQVGLELEGLAYGLLRSTHDFREGVEAFGEKRPPRFEGR
jgi:2-oxoglutaroyl-CoA hydrolase